MLHNTFLAITQWNIIRRSWSTENNEIFTLAGNVFLSSFVVKPEGYWLRNNGGYWKNVDTHVFSLSLRPILVNTISQEHVHKTSI